MTELGLRRAASAPLSSGWARAARVLGAIDPFVFVFVLVGAALRLGWAFDAQLEPVAEGIFYQQHAADLAAGRGYVHPETGAPSAFLPPGYSLLLGAVYLFTGPSATAAALLNVALSIVTLLFVFGIARHFFGLATGRLSVLVLALFPSQILYTPAITPDILTTALVTGVVWAALVPSRANPNRRLLLCGLFLGAAILAVPKLGLLLPATVVAWLLLGLGWRASLRRAAIVVACAVLVVLPWAVRNSIELGTPVVAATNGGVNLWIGNNSDAYGGWMPWDERGDRWTYPADEPGSDREFTRKAFSYALQNPVGTVRIWPEKLRLTFEQDFAYVAHFSLVPRDRPLNEPITGGLLERWSNRYYEVAFAFAVLGAALFATRGHRGTVLLLPVAALILPVVIFFGMDRFHVPLLPFFAIFASAVAVTAVRETAAQAARWPLPDLAGNRLPSGRNNLPG